MPSRFRMVLIFLLVPLFGTNVSAQASQPGQGQAPVTELRELLGQLVANNPDILAAKYRFEAATKRPPQVSTLPEPKLALVNFGVGQPFSGFVNEFAYRAIGVSQEIPFPGKLELAGEEAQREADSDRENYRSIVLEKTSQLKAVYYDWYSVTKAIEITSKNRDLLDRFEQIARARYSVGKGIQPDVLKAQVEVSGLAQQLEMLQQKKIRHRSANPLFAELRSPTGPPLRDPAIAYAASVGLCASNGRKPVAPASSEPGNGPKPRCGYRPRSQRVSSRLQLQLPIPEDRAGISRLLHGDGGNKAAPSLLAEAAARGRRGRSAVSGSAAKLSGKPPGSRLRSERQVLHRNDQRKATGPFSVRDYSAIIRGPGVGALRLRSRKCGLPHASKQRSHIAELRNAVFPGAGKTRAGACRIGTVGRDGADSHSAVKRRKGFSHGRRNESERRESRTST